LHVTNVDAIKASAEDSSTNLLESVEKIPHMTVTYLWHIFYMSSDKTGKKQNKETKIWE